MKYRNLLFDLDGTLTDSSEGIIKCAIYAFEKMGIEDPDIEELRERYIPIGKFENKPYPGMIDLLDRLKKEGFKLYVATSKPEKTAKEVAFDVRGAAELGIPCIGVTWGFGDLNEMRDAGAIGIVETMEQLYEMVK
ncbi:MAG: HAD hydrolase-like protein [Lachnospiraceae bacterium]|nr:HAD hydrolase-like protein [Lachnospiraceae bacterium]